MDFYTDVKAQQPQMRDAAQARQTDPSSTSDMIIDTFIPRTGCHSASEVV